MVYLNIYHLLYIFFLTLLLTFAFTLILKNKGPWNNPMLFFLVLFMTSWALMIWLYPVTAQHVTYPVLTITIVTILLSLLLAATKGVNREKSEMRKVDDRQVVDVVTKPEENRYRILPNLYFWILLILETMLIVTAYVFRYYEIIT